MVGDSMQENMLQKEAVEVIKTSTYGNLGLAMNHQPYMRFIKYKWDINMGCINIIMDVNKKGVINKIISCNEKVAFLINKCYRCYYETVLIEGKVCILKDDNKNKETIVIVPEMIEGHRLFY